MIATLEDYAVVRELVVDIVSEGVEATVPATVRELVEAVAALRGAALDRPAGDTCSAWTSRRPRGAGRTPEPAAT